MKCSRAKRKLIAFIDDELSRQERSDIEEHLNLCPICSKDLNILSKISGAIRRDEEIEPSPYFRSKVRRRIEAQEKRPVSLKEIVRSLIKKPLPKIVALVLFMGLLFIPSIVRKSSAATKVLINVEGMTPNCCETIKASLTKLAGIEDIDIVPEEGIVCITIKKGKQVNLKKVEMAICDTGPYFCKDFNVICDSAKK